MKTRKYLIAIALLAGMMFTAQALHASQDGADKAKIVNIDR